MPVVVTGQKRRGALCVKGRGSVATELGSSQAAARRHWPGAPGAGSEGPATSTPAPSPRGGNLSVPEYRSQTRMGGFCLLFYCYAATDFFLKLTLSVELLDLRFKFPYSHVAQFSTDLMIDFYYKIKNI